MSLSGIREAIATALKTISGLRVYDTAPESIGELPAAYILPRGGSYDSTFGGSMEHRLEVVLLVQRGGSLSEAQDQLDSYLAASGTKSIKAAVDAADLTGHADTIRLEGYRDYGGMEFAGQGYLGCKFDITVFI